MPWESLLRARMGRWYPTKKSWEPSATAPHFHMAQPSTLGGGVYTCDVAMEEGAGARAPPPKTTRGGVDKAAVLKMFVEQPLGSKAASAAVDESASLHALLGKLQQLTTTDDPEATEGIWRMTTKAKAALPSGERLENLSWRLLHMSLRKRDCRGREAATSVASDSPTPSANNARPPPTVSSTSPASTASLLLQHTKQEPRSPSMSDFFDMDINDMASNATHLIGRVENSSPALVRHCSTQQHYEQEPNDFGSISIAGSVPEQHAQGSGVFRKMPIPPAQVGKKSQLSLAATAGSVGSIGSASLSSSTASTFRENGGGGSGSTSFANGSLSTLSGSVQARSFEDVLRQHHQQQQHNHQQQQQHIHQQQQHQLPPQHPFSFNAGAHHQFQQSPQPSQQQAQLPTNLSHDQINSLFLNGYSPQMDVDKSMPNLLFPPNMPSALEIIAATNHIAATNPAFFQQYSSTAPAAAATAAALQQLSSSLSSLQYANTAFSSTASLANLFSQTPPPSFTFPPQHHLHQQSQQLHQQRHQPPAPLQTAHHSPASTSDTLSPPPRTQSHPSLANSLAHPLSQPSHIAPSPPQQQHLQQSTFQKKPAIANPEQTCHNCGTSNTPMWRRDNAGRVVCNACGVYFRVNGVNRVVKQGGTAVKRRVRVKEVPLGDLRRVSSVPDFAGRGTMVAGAPASSVGPSRTEENGTLPPPAGSLKRARFDM